VHNKRACLSYAMEDSCWHCLGLLHDLGMMGFIGQLIVRRSRIDFIWNDADDPKTSHFEKSNGNHRLLKVQGCNHEYHPIVIRFEG
jgi:hypothetical protein